MSRKEAILKAARDLFAERGYDGTSTSEIAERAGVAHGTVFHHFKTKQNLLLEMGNTLSDAYLEGLQRLSLDQSSGWEALERMIRYHFTFMQEHVTGMVIMVLESPRVLDTASRGAHAQHIRRCLEAVRTIRRQILERGLQDGSLCPCPSEETHFLLESLLNGIVNLHAKGWAEVPAGLEEATVEFCRRSLAASA